MKWRRRRRRLIVQLPMLRSNPGLFKNIQAVIFRGGFYLAFKAEVNRPCQPFV